MTTPEGGLRFDRVCKAIGMPSSSSAAIPDPRANAEGAVRHVATGLRRRAAHAPVPMASSFLGPHAAQRTIAVATTRRSRRFFVAGEFSDRILEAAKERGADLIVMGTHGRRGISRVFLGSVAEKTV